VNIEGVEVLDDLGEVWLSLFDHHQAMGNAGLPAIAREKSWRFRRALYARIFVDPRAFVVVARRRDQIVGYALAQVHDGPDDTWPTGDIGEIETLAVLPAERGAGLGTRLLDAAEAHLHQAGVNDITLAVMVGNADAERFYARRGMVPIVTKYLALRRPGSVGDVEGPSEGG
jgi:GNAT superfamily N-acetyltransferase